jgi:hypothetical protein
MARAGAGAKAGPEIFAVMSAAASLTRPSTKRKASDI